MTVVQNVQKRPDQTAWSYAAVSVGIIGPGFTGSIDQISGVSKDLADGTGLVSFDLAPGLYYVWTGPDGQQTQFGPVPASGGPYDLDELANSPAFAPPGETAATETALLDAKVELQAQLDAIPSVDPDSSALTITGPAGLGHLLNPSDVGDDGFAPAGQSNEAGYGNGFDAMLDTTDPRIVQFAGSGTYLGQRVAASDPLIMHEQQGANRIGHAMTFARNYVRTIPANRSACIIGCAHGSTGFTTTGSSANGNWDPAGGHASVNLYEFLIAQIQAWQALNPNNRLKAVIWLQGESDGSLTQSQYTTYLLALIDGVRTRLGIPDLVFLIGQMTRYAQANNAGLPGINLAHIDIPRVRTRTAFFYGPDDLADPTYGNVPRDLHYSAKGQRVVGANAFAALALARANVLGKAPVAPSAVTLTQVGTTVNAAWTRMPQHVTDYTVEYNTGSGWTTLTRTTPNIDNTAAITGLTLGGTVQVRVKTTNDVGTSSPSPVASLTLAKVPNAVTGGGHGTATAQTVPLTWTASAVDGTHDAATSYLVEFKKHTDPTYTVFGTVASPAVTVTGLAVSSSYDFRITASNAGGSASGVVHTTSTATLNAILTDIGVTALRAYGLRLLKSSFAGSAIRVRRSSDNTEMDIGFDASGNLDSPTLATFGAGTDCFIKTWYDQSGSGWDLTQATTTAQAQIVSSGTIITRNGQPAALFNGTTHFYTDNHTGLYSAGAASILAVRQDGVGVGTHYFAMEAGTTAVYGLGAETAGASSGFTQSVIQTDAGAIVANVAGNLTTSDQLHVVDYTDTGSALTHHVDGTAPSTANGVAYTRGTTTPTKFILGAKSTVPASVWGGYLSEALFFASALSSTPLAAGRTNAKSYYATP